MSNMIRPRLCFRLVLGHSIAVGPGKADLLAALAETGSISAVARSMGMSYKKAWYLLDAMNHAFRKPLIQAEKGGKGHGGAKLTPTGLQVLALYRAIESQAAAAAAKDLRRLANWSPKLRNREHRRLARDAGYRYSQMATSRGAFMFCLQAAVSRRLFVAAFVAGMTWGYDSIAVAAEEPPIAAAADLNAALPEVVDVFTKETGKKVKITFGSSGNFAQQNINGAPFEVYLSADEGYVDKLNAAGKTDGVGALYATGRIGLFQPNGSSVRVDDQLRDLAAAVRDGRLVKFAIANPEHAPYRRAAEEALAHAGLWNEIRPKLVLGENVAQATQFATSGSAQGGIIPLSLAFASGEGCRHLRPA